FPYHPPPHSFPTRRSSDLLRRTFEFLHHRLDGLVAIVDQQIPCRDTVRTDHMPLPILTIRPRVNRLPAAIIDNRNLALATVRFRSEEHTSELQSRVDLVCR